jgi:integrase
VSLYKRPNSATFSYDFRRGGRRFSGDTGCTTRREAEAVERARIEEVERLVAAGLAATAALTLDYVSGRYWDEVGQHHAGAHHTERNLARLLDYFDDGMSLMDIDDNAVARLVAWRRGQRVPGEGDPSKRPLLAPGTVNLTVTIQLRKLFGYAKRVLRARFEHEPIWRNHMLKEPQERVRELHAGEGERIEAATRADYLPFFAFLEASGVRRKEAVGLRWSEVDFANCQIVKTGKGGRLIVVPITPEIREILFPLQGHHEQFVFTYVAQFTTKQSRKTRATVAGLRYPLTDEGLQSYWRRLRPRAKVENFRMHDYRHNYGTKLLRLTGNLKLVQRAMNHADIKTTTRYAHVSDAEVTAAIEAMQMQARDQKSHQKSHPRPRLAAKGD